MEVSTYLRKSNVFGLPSSYIKIPSHCPSFDNINCDKPLKWAHNRTQNIVQGYSREVKDLEQCKSII